MEAYHLDSKDNLGILRLHASNANAMNDQVLQAMSASLQEAASANLKGLILAGYDRFFSAGLDLLAVYEFNREQMRRFIADWEATMIRLFEFPMPVIAAINGAATAGGCILAMACDYRIMAAEGAVIGMNGIRENAEELREKFLDIWFSSTVQRAIGEARSGLLAKRQ